MNKDDYAGKIENLRNKLSGFPVNTPGEVKIAADQLDGMSADLGIGNLEIDYRNLDSNGALAMFDRIVSLSFEELESDRNIERPYSGGDKEEWARGARLSRLEILVKQYGLLCRLRADDPEAWDEINELFYDD